MSERDDAQDGKAGTNGDIGGEADDPLRGGPGAGDTSGEAVPGGDLGEALGTGSEAGLGGGTGDLGGGGAIGGDTGGLGDDEAGGLSTGSRE